jgi:pimeloyl-ACP methyl ester carboxylesterase
MSAEHGEPNGELILCEPASLDRAFAARPTRSPISTGIPQESVTFGNEATARGGSGRYDLSTCDSTLYLVPSAGHFSTLDNPIAFNRILGRFFDGLPRGVN